MRHPGTMAGLSNISSTAPSQAWRSNTMSFDRAASAARYFGTGSFSATSRACSLAASARRASRTENQVVKPAPTNTNTIRSGQGFSGIGAMREALLAPRASHSKSTGWQFG